MYEYEIAEVLDVHDGDTCHVRIDLGLHIFVDAHIRLAHINAPELHEAKGAEAQRRFAELLTATPLQINTIRDRTEKYGRWLGVITNGNHLDIGATLVHEGLAVLYEGGRR